VSEAVHGATQQNAVAGVAGSCPRANLHFQQERSAQFPLARMREVIEQRQTTPA
jgi:hypothetical protein